MAKTVIKNLFNIDQHVEMYFEIIENNLDFPPDVRRRYMRFLKYEVAKYLLHHPEALMSDICKKFGDPYEQNAAVVKMIENGFARERRRRNLLFMIITFVLVVLLVLAISFSVYCFMRSDAYVYVSDVHQIGVGFL